MYLFMFFIGLTELYYLYSVGTRYSRHADARIIATLDVITKFGGLTNMRIDFVHMYASEAHCTHSCNCGVSGKSAYLSRGICHIPVAFHINLQACR